MRLINRFIQLSRSEKRLLIEAIALLLYAWLIVKVIPFSRYRHKYKIICTREPEHTPAIARAIKVAISRANKIAFWNNKCLVSSLAARIMLTRRNITSKIYLGIKIIGQKEMTAHAWLMVGNYSITPKGSGNFKEIYNF